MRVAARNVAYRGWGRQESNRTALKEVGGRSDETAKDRRQKSSPRAFLVAVAEPELEYRGERSLRAEGPEGFYVHPYFMIFASWRC